jgi:hypothetical protein
MFTTDESFMDFLLHPAEMNFKDFKRKGVIRLPWEYKKYEKNGFATPTGKVQLFDPKLESLGFDPFPGYVEPAEGFPSSAMRSSAISPFCGRSSLN